MTQEQHPITPLPELVQKIAGGPGTWLEKISKAYCAGADQELEACCEWLVKNDWKAVHKHLRAARRPPPSLKELNLKHLDVMERDGYYLPEIISDLRRAIESLPS